MCDARIEWEWLTPKGSSTCAVVTNYAYQVSNVVVDLGSRRYFRPMNQVKEDGGKHRPAQRDVSIYYDSKKCRLPAMNRNSVKPILKHSLPSQLPSVTIHEAIISSRGDDHNPFFMMSLLFNAWAAKRRHEFSKPPELLVLGEKIPQRIDILWTALIGQNQSVVRYSDDLPDRFFVERGYMLTSEWESPITQDLSTRRPRCMRPSTMIQAFFRDATRAMQSQSAVDTKQITFIRRQNYVSGGKFRHVGRILLNDERIIQATAEALPTYTVRGLLMEKMTQQQQIEAMQKSQVVIGMHGAGMVNVGFMQPGANRLVIEIFPRTKERWGYRNLCHYMNMSYIDYRSGADHGDGHKTIDVERWIEFVKSYVRPYEVPYYSTIGSSHPKRRPRRNRQLKYDVLHK